jgi:Tfp pilus assembly protein PilF
MVDSLQLTGTALHEHVLHLLQCNDLAAAHAACRRLNAEHPGYAFGWRTASIIAHRLGDPAGALACVDRSLALTPADGRALIHRAHCLHALHRPADAFASAAAAREAADSDAILLDSLGTFYSFAGDPAQARAAYDRALELAPGHPGILFNRAAVRRFLGELAEAESDLDRVIAKSPTDYEAYKARSDLRTQTADRNHAAELERVLAQGISDWRGEVQIRYALAKEYEDLGDYARSWTNLAQGAQCRHQHLRYDVSVDVDTVQWITDAFPAKAAPIAGCPSTEPIFIVGMPRSGSTLVERILGSHSEVFAAGELNDLAHAIVHAVRSRSGAGQMPRQMGRAELVARSAALDFAALGRDYLERTRPMTGRVPRFTDKMPLNYLYCGLICRALPNARIIHVSRRPMAACYALYKTLFKEGYPFSYDLEQLGRYYVSYRRLMNHWLMSMPNSIHQVSYERLVEDPRGEVSRLLDFCGLSWEDACLDFHRNPAPTMTASAVQVRQPLYTTSIQQWRHYGPQLEGLRQQLIAAGLSDVETGVQAHN